MSQMRLLSNRVRFGEEEDTTSDGLLGVGMLGKGQQTGKVRVSAKEQKLLSEKNKKRAMAGGESCSHVVLVIVRDAMRSQDRAPMESSRLLLMEAMPLLEQVDQVQPMVLPRPLLSHQFKGLSLSIRMRMRMQRKAPKHISPKRPRSSRTTFSHVDNRLLSVSKRPSHRA